MSICCNSQIAPEIPGEPQVARGCCSYIDMIPPIVALVASIIAIIAGVHFQSTAFAVVGGIGALSSIYAVVTAYYARDVASIHESAVRNAGQVIRLTTEVNRLEEENNTFATTNANLAETTERQRKALEDLERDLRLSQDTTRGLETLFQTMQQEFGNQAEQTRTLTTLVETARDSASNLPAFQQALEASLPQLAALTNSLNRYDLARQHDRLATLLRDLHATQQQLHQTELGLTTLRAEIPLLQQVRDDLNTEVTALQEARQRLEEQMNDLQRQLTRLATEVDRLSSVNG